MDIERDNRIVNKVFRIVGDGIEPFDATGQPIVSVILKLKRNINYFSDGFEAVSIEVTITISGAFAIIVVFLINGINRFYRSRMVVSITVPIFVRNEGVRIKIFTAPKKEENFFENVEKQVYPKEVF